MQGGDPAVFADFLGIRHARRVGRSQVGSQPDNNVIETMRRADKMRVMRTAILRTGAILLATVPVSTAQSQQTVSPNPGKDANGNPLRVAVKTGHVSNYDEDKVKPYRLPDPLVFAGGGRVADAAAWKKRRNELIEPFQMIVPSRRNRTFDPRVILPSRT